MRAVVQRVCEARVTVAAELVGEMGAGLLALVGVASEDGEADAKELAAKLVHLRVFPDAEGRMNRSLLETGGTLGVVSQFTLLGDARKGRRPSYVRAAEPPQAEPLVEAVVQEARRLGVTTITGRFRAAMRVALVNDGPVTILLDTTRQF
ncbi:MAG: D-tyrosyl-tRNA(Tyr) deacylase [Deltaproteobacteria bacterium]|nr:D-tyrosyl-tRNA(Tyr) deacylase [Deltaproteobacteria bacterium]